MSPDYELACEEQAAFFEANGINSWQDLVRYRAEERRRQMTFAENEVARRQFDFFVTRILSAIADAKGVIE